jgi:threonine/homoserine/homoserine lactone efflux protein
MRVVEMSLLELLCFGLVAGLSPSPHSVFLLCTSLQEPAASRKVLTGGILGDLVIIFSTGLLAFEGPQLLRPYLSIIGSLCMIFMGWKLFRGGVPAPSSARRSLNAPLVGAFGIQLLNPYPYMFWSGIFFVRHLESKNTEIFIAALLFLCLVHSVKWVVYGAWARGLTASLRVLMARGAFLVFCASYLIRELGTWI